MDFKKIMKMQIALDSAIEKAHGVLKEQVKDKKVVALLVEICEFANEYAPFKYWKKNKVIKRDSLVEEFVDGIHFFISLYSYFGSEQTIIEPRIVDEDQTKQLLETIVAVTKLKDEFNIDVMNEAFSLYMGNAKLIGISDQEIETHYLDKNKINYERIANNY